MHVMVQICILRLHIVLHFSTFNLSYLGTEPVGGKRMDLFTIKILVLCCAVLMSSINGKSNIS